MSHNKFYLVFILSFFGLFSANAGNNTITIQKASARGQIKVVKELLKNGTNVNEKEAKYGFTALHLASYKGQIEIVKFLLEKGADIHAKCDVNDTPLHAASLGGQAKIVKLLLDKGANVNSADSDGYTALHFASYGYIDVVKALLDKGANVNAKDNYGNTAIKFALENCQNEIVKFLLTRGAKESLLKLNEKCISSG